MPVSLFLYFLYSSSLVMFWMQANCFSLSVQIPNLTTLALSIARATRMYFCRRYRMKCQQPISVIIEFNELLLCMRPDSGRIHNFRHNGNPTLCPGKRWRHIAEPG